MSYPRTFATFRRAVANFFSNAMGGRRELSAEDRERTSRLRCVDYEGPGLEAVWNAWIEWEEFYTDCKADGAEIEEIQFAWDDYEGRRLLWDSCVNHYDVNDAARLAALHACLYREATPTLEDLEEAPLRMHGSWAIVGKTMQFAFHEGSWPGLYLREKAEGGWVAQIGDTGGPLLEIGPTEEGLEGDIEVTPLLAMSLALDFYRAELRRMLELLTNHIAATESFTPYSEHVSNHGAWSVKVLTYDANNDRVTFQAGEKRHTVSGDWFQSHYSLEEEV